MLDYFTALEITGAEHTQDLYKMYCYLLQERPRIIPAIESEGYKAGTFAMPKRNADKDFLTQGEVQFLVKILEKELRDTVLRKYIWKKDSKIYYQFCDPDNPSTEKYFHCYNQSKDNYKAHAQKYNKLSAIQRKLKKLRSKP